jgi:hypothetical protein
MSKVGRPQNTIPTIEWKCHISIPVAAKVDAFLLDPVSLKPRYGARSALVTQLLVQWLNTKGVNPYKETASDEKAKANPAEKAAEAE